MIDHRERLAELIEKGEVCQDFVIGALINWLSQDEIIEFCRLNEIQLYPDDTDDTFVVSIDDGHTICYRMPNETIDQLLEIESVGEAKEFICEHGDQLNSQEGADVTLDITNGDSLEEFHRQINQL